MNRLGQQLSLMMGRIVPLVDFQLRAGHFGHAAKADIDVKSLSDKSGPHAAINPLWVNPGVWN